MTHVHGFDDWLKKQYPNEQFTPVMLDWMDKAFHEGLMRGSEERDRGYIKTGFGLCKASVENFLKGLDLP